MKKNFDAKFDANFDANFDAKFDAYFGAKARLTGSEKKIARKKFLGPKAPKILFETVEAGWPRQDGRTRKKV